MSDFHSGHMDVDEHFRRSLANLPGCKDILDKCVSSVSTTSKNNTQVIQVDMTQCFYYQEFLNPQTLCMNNNDNNQTTSVYSLN